MPVTTDLEVYPYFDDFDPKKDFYRVLFKPSVAVQVRELNQLQDYSATQIERLADNLFKSGTITEGCNFIFNDNQPYVKLLDTETNGETPVVPSLFEGRFIKNSNGLAAYVVDSTDGFETSTPDLKTIFVNYINSGIDANTHSFAPGERLLVTDPKNLVFSVNTEDGGTGFSVTDTVVFVSKVAVNVTSGAFSSGDFLVDPSIGGVANLEIVEVDTTTLLSQGQVLMTLKPRLADLVNSASNSSNWTVSASMTIANPSNTAIGVVQKVYGTGASANLVVSSAGVITQVNMITRGRDYEYNPYVTVKSPSNNFGVDRIDLIARNYIAEVQVDSSPSAIGNGYVFGVSEGTIYQKGHFLRVTPQTIIVEKYSTRPNNVVVGFKTDETIVDSDIDTSLLDNAIGENNYTAPGADRLKMVPVLVLMTKEEAETTPNFFSLVEWNDGNPYKQNQVTQYSRIGEEIARGIYETSGSFVLDRFQVITTSVEDIDLEGTYFTVNVDPGLAYIEGHRIQTRANFALDIPKGLDTKVSNNIVSVNYGNYLRVNQVGGSFLFKTGATVNLYNRPKAFLSNTALIVAANTDPVGTQIGSAKIRSMVLETDKPGQPNSIFRMYLFDIQMNAGQNFKEVRTLHYDGTYDGIADVVLDFDASSGQLIAAMKDTRNDGLLFSTGVESVKNTNNATYVYRTIDISTAAANNGTLRKDITSIPDETFQGVGNLTSSELRDLYVVPVSNNLVQYTSMTGTVTINTTSNTVVGAGTNFYSDFQEGDYIYITNGSFTEIKNVVKIVNATALTVDSVFSTANVGASFKRVFPQNVPVPFGYRDGLTANVNSTNKILTLSFHHSNGLQITFEGTTSVNTALGHNVRRSNISSVPKVANRSQYIKIKPANNSGGMTGPWCLGVPDAFRLRNVYVANTVDVNTASPSIVSSFYVDHNQNENFLSLGYLFKTPSSRLTLENDDFLLVEFDYFTRNDAGYVDVVSYRGSADAEDIAETDSKPLSDLAGTAHSFEIPEVYTTTGNYYDLNNQLDFRPSVEVTAVPASDPVVAPVNPVETESFDQLTDKKFPIPDGSGSFQVEQYLGRVDTVYISNEGNVFTGMGIPDIDPRKRYISNDPNNAIRLQVLYVPPYPSVAEVNSNAVNEILNRRLANERFLNIRLDNHKVKPLLTASDIQKEQPLVYTQEDIGNLERRITDLEYYVSLSALESSLSSKVIPSSINPALARFKFGFIADDFSTNNFSDFRNPQYSASFEIDGDNNNGLAQSNTNIITAALMNSSNAIQKKATNRIVPSKFNWSLDHSLNGQLLDNVPYIDEAIISQTYATVPVPISVPANSINSDNLDSNTEILVDPDPRIPPYQSNTIAPTIQQGLFSMNCNYSQKVGIINLQSAPNVATLYFFVAAGTVAFTVGKEINGQFSNVVSTFDGISNTGVMALSNSDLTFLSNQPLVVKQMYNGGVPFNINSPLNEDIITTNGQEGYFKNCVGKLQFSLENANNDMYSVIVEPWHTLSSSWSLLLVYPFLDTVDNQTIVNVSQSVINNPNYNRYDGTMTVSSAMNAADKLFNVNHRFSGAVRIDCTGLKPGTVHVFSDSPYVVPLYYGSPTKIITQEETINWILNGPEKPLITDSSGRLSFIAFVASSYNDARDYYEPNRLTAKMVNYQVTSLDSNLNSYSKASYQGLIKEINNQGNV